MSLGDAGVPNTDASYTGETSTSVFSLDYYRDKALEFQSVLNALDQSQRAADAALTYVTDPATWDDLVTALDEFAAKRAIFKATADAINLGANAVNAMGGRFPVLSVPQTLGLAPLLPVAAIAAVATAATLIVWGREWIKGVNERLQAGVYLDAIADPQQRATAAAALAQSEQAVRIAESSPLAGVASIVKWGAIAVGAFLVFKAVSGPGGLAGYLGTRRR